jgi:hypothetical protein
MGVLNSVNIFETSAYLQFKGRKAYANMLRFPLPIAAVHTRLLLLWGETMSGVPGGVRQ